MVRRGRWRYCCWLNFTCIGHIGFLFPFVRRKSPEIHINWAIVVTRDYWKSSDSDERLECEVNAFGMLIKHRLLSYVRISSNGALDAIIHTHTWVLYAYSIMPHSAPTNPSAIFWQPFSGRMQYSADAHGSRQAQQQQQQQAANSQMITIYSLIFIVSISIDNPFSTQTLSLLISLFLVVLSLFPFLCLFRSLQIVFVPLGADICCVRCVRMRSRSKYASVYRTKWQRVTRWAGEIWLRGKRLSNII